MSQNERDNCSAQALGVVRGFFLDLYEKGEATNGLVK